MESAQGVSAVATKKRHTRPRNGQINVVNSQNSPSGCCVKTNKCKNLTVVHFCICTNVLVCISTKLFAMFVRCGTIINKL